MAKAKAKAKGNGKKAAPARFGELDQYLFGQATHYEIYRKMGAHPLWRTGKRASGSRSGRPMPAASR